MDLMRLINTIKHHPEYDRVGMILCHNGVVRETSRDGRSVTGLRIRVDHEKLILVEIAADRDLAVGEDVMLLVVAGDIRENVIMTLTDTLNAIKSQVTEKIQFFR